MISSFDQARRRRRLNQRIRELIAVRRAVGREAPEEPDPPQRAVAAAPDETASAAA